MNKLNGFLYGLLSSASFGLIPLFTIPAMREGMNFESILFYRFLFACLALGCILLLDKQSFHIKRKEIPSLMLLAFLYLMSAVFLFWGYKFMASGVATTIHFMYPVLTTLIMMIFFRERKSTWRFFAIALADPKKDPSAVKYDTITYDDMLAQHLQVMDSTATSLSMDNKIPVVLFALKDPENILRVVMGEKIGTIVKEEP